MILEIQQCNSSIEIFTSTQIATLFWLASSSLFSKVACKGALSSIILASERAPPLRILLPTYFVPRCIPLYCILLICIT